MKQDHYKNIGVVILVLFALSFFFGDNYPFLRTKYFFAPILVFGILVFTFEKLAILFSTYWMKLGKALGVIPSSILLSIFFFVLIAPLGVIKRLFTKKQKFADSSWIKVEEEEENFSNPW